MEFGLKKCGFLSESRFVHRYYKQIGKYFVFKYIDYGGDAFIVTQYTIYLYVLSRNIVIGFPC